VRLRVRGNRVEGGVPVNASCQLVKQEGRPAETARLALLRSASSEVLLLRGDLPAREERRNPLLIDHKHPPKGGRPHRRVGALARQSL
jgi:hypothetical protein